MSEFMVGFLANLTSDAIIALIFGVLVALWINKKLEERKENEEYRKNLLQEAEKAAKIIEVIQGYYLNLYPEIKKWIALFEEAAKKGNYHEPITLGTIPRFDISFWEVYKNGGELTKFLEPRYVKHLCVFFGSLADARESMNWAYANMGLLPTGSIVEEMRMKEYAKLTCESLLIAYREFEELKEFGFREGLRLNGLINSLKGIQ